MKIPNNLTQEELMYKMEGVINRIAPKYTFNGYDVDDIKQEAFMICVDALERYDEKRPLENFLSVHLSNRLKNFVRDNYYVSSTDEDKKKLLTPKMMGTDDIISENEELIDPMEKKEIEKIIDSKLPPQYRSDYLKISSGVYVNKKRREEITQIILDILKESGYA